MPRSAPDPPPDDKRLQRWARINYVGEVPDGSGRLYVPDLNGKLYLLRDGVPTTYLDVGGTFEPDFWATRGLGSGFGFVTFHPEFARNGKFYTTHTETGRALTEKPPHLPTQPGTVIHSVVTEWTAADPAAPTFRGTHREMLRIGFSGFTHAIQQIDFNPNARPGDEDYGLLYLAVGDGGRGVSSTDPQNLAVPQGKMLRIDPAGTDGASGQYGVPRVNPFHGRPGVLGEIFSYGYRDPHRFSWDTGGRQRLYLGHIGEHAIEAVYDVREGDNSGWSQREGAFVYKRSDRCYLWSLPADDAKNRFAYPVAAYDHDPPPSWQCRGDVGRAIAGGFVYRGSKVPELQGKYLFADLVDGRVFYTESGQMVRGAKRLAPLHQVSIFDSSGKRTSMPELAGDARVDLRFGTDSSGELYVLSKANGKIWRVTGVRPVDPAASAVTPSLEPDLVAHYDFAHPAADRARERDLGRSGTQLNLVNGGAAMRVPGAAYPRGGQALETRQVNPDRAGNDDWKAGVYDAGGTPTLGAFNGVRETTVMGWFRLGPDNPARNSGSADPDDRYGAVGLAGVLSGDSNGHAVRALLELIEVDGQLRVVALGRRLDGGASQTFAANADWRTLLPENEWVFLAATFDFDKGTMALYRNGQPVPGFYVVPGDPWQVKSAPGPHYTSPTNPRGFKIGGSYPQNTREGNACNCRYDDLMFLDRAASQAEIAAQYHLSVHG
ncbi:hypothetical protein EWH70_28325 [Amycolatopsis suaedae]|uniref:Glucose/Sorbosone dehydrogenase domain-containing protein n=2 Tax=Amycolatopsis suaedae TaxID=2510978 RepID=A0A4Q7J1G8_9PSEU|nr:hypothetical protein EWH70_28325 [Amycolatopsis suaedae]